MKKSFGNCIICGQEMILKTTNDGSYITCGNRAYKNLYFHYGVKLENNNLDYEFFNFEINNGHINISRNFDQFIMIEYSFLTVASSTKLPDNLTSDRITSDFIKKIMMLK